MTTLYDLLDKDELEEMIAEKRIAKQVHPNLPISIYNYTQRAQYANIWTNSERVCRGLIVDDKTLEVIARGPSKFFNYGQPGAPETSLDSLVKVTTKHDGSLGIAWAYGQGDTTHFGVATRGSFTSEQAIKAHKIANKKEFPDFLEEILDTSRSGKTSVFEIIYPENRIVVSYGDEESLRYLGDVDNISGLIEYRPDEIEFSSVITLQEALELDIPADEEGYVLDIVEKVQKFSGHYYDVLGHVKLKGEEYKILHGLLTNTNARRIWVQLAARACEHLIESDDDWNRLLHHNAEDFKRVNTEQDIVDTLLKNVPDEFYDWVTKKIDSIEDRVSDLTTQAMILTAQAAAIPEKRERYELVKDHPLCREILQYVEKKDYSRIHLKAWQLAKPEGNDTPFKAPSDED
jgi:RNA ligase